MSPASRWRRQAALAGVVAPRARSDLMNGEAHSWGISDTAFLTAFAIVCGLYLLIALVIARVDLRRRREPAIVEQPDRYELAMLTGGSLCVLTAAAAALRQTGALGMVPAGFVATGAGDGATDDVEREILAALSPGSPTTAHDLRRRLIGGPAHARLAAKLAGDGLLRAPWQERWRGRLANLAWALTATSFARFVFAAVDPPDGPMSGPAVTSLCLGLLFPSLMTIATGRSAPGTTPAGRALLGRERERHGELATGVVPGPQIALAVALFGSEPLRRTDPELADAWGILSPEEAQLQAAMLG
jgi:uncharacterized protein (TIGR04222 family)